MKPLSIIYRGPLRTCNFRCWYCPAGRTEPAAKELARDVRGLTAFVEWVRGSQHPVAILFAPLGEVLTLEHYRRAVVTLSRMPHVHKVAVQTNLSCDPGWLDGGSREKVALWCSYHPDWIARAAFLARLESLRQLGVRFSVGMVAVPSAVGEIAAMRRALPGDEYLWLNAYKHPPVDLGAEDLARLTAVDPLFPFSTRHVTKGRPCRAGVDVVAVDETGTVRRCPFVPRPMGSLQHLARSEVPQPCPNETCSCHIGYVHLQDLGLRELFGDRFLERIR